MSARQVVIVVLGREGTPAARLLARIDQFWSEVSGSASAPTSDQPEEIAEFVRIRALEACQLAQLGDRFRLRVVRGSTPSEIIDTVRSDVLLHGALLLRLYVACESIDPDAPESIETLLGDLADAGLEPSVLLEGATVLTSPAVRPRLHSLVATYGSALEVDEGPSCEAQIMAQLTDVLLALAGGQPGPAPGPATGVALAGEIARMMQDLAFGRWALFSYTGSPVSSLIADLDALAKQCGIVHLRGPNEHSLACGALANWVVSRMPCVIVVTSGMLDELKGTLSNLRSANAAVLVVVAEIGADPWFAFQSTLTSDEDMRNVLAARHIEYAHVERADDLAAALGRAGTTLGSRHGPFVLLVAPTVLEYRGQLTAAPRVSSLSSMSPSAVAVDELSSRLLAPETSRVLLCLEDVEPGDERLAIDLAVQTGAALADSLAHPGTIPTFRRGRAVDHYLGMLGLYGLSREVFEYLCPDGEASSSNRPALLLLGSRAGQLTLPWNAKALERSVDLYQVTVDPAHFSPHVPARTLGRTRDVLSALLRATQSIDRQTVRSRELEMQAARRRAALVRDLAVELPVYPLAPNRFLHLFANTVRELIETTGYEFSAVFDVGRFGMSAARHVPRTGRAFSGWFGRALMGDAYLAAGSLFLAGTKDVVAFVGDGAEAQAPDPVPWILESLAAAPEIKEGCLTIIVGHNALFSFIETHRQRLFKQTGGRQMRVPDPRARSAPRRSRGPRGFEVHEELLFDYAPEFFRDALTARKRINILRVALSHNNFSDGLSVYSEADWYLRRRPGPDALVSKPRESRALPPPPTAPRIG